jgi:hypothetical protein
MNPNDILKKATNILIELQKNSIWENELISKAPPVLWFGNSKSLKPKIVTIGANPSRWEFLDTNKLKSKHIEKAVYEKYYLINKRFYHLTNGEFYDTIITSEKVQNDIISSYDSYFSVNPYTRWFGKSIDPYRVEGALRGMGASFYESDSNLSAIHIDLFPFPTMSDYMKIKLQVDTYILKQVRNQEVFNSILEYLQPTLLLIFGKSNFSTFSNLFSLGRTTYFNFNSGKITCNVWQTTFRSWKVIGLSVNLGNPYGFYKIDLKNLGKYLLPMI